jgi:RHS repeat-associated protein
VYNLTNSTPSTRYFHTDHLGSVDTITNETGAVAQRLSYDAFGKRRNANGTDAASITAQTTRGFTRHEHDDEVGLVNMNAREYDPLLGRFATPDTLVQFTHHSQSYNRYGYVHNNPLSFTDPTGRGLGKWLKKTVKKYGRTIVAAVAAYYSFNYVSNWMQAGVSTTGASTSFTSAGTFIGTDTAGGFFATSLTTAGGAVAGGSFGAVYGGISSGNLSGAIQGARGGAISGGLFTGANLLSSDWNAFGLMAARSTAAGLTADIRGGSFSDAFRMSFGIEGLSWAALTMREAMWQQSCQGGSNDNCTGQSTGFRGIGGKLGGARCIEGGMCPSSLLGGVQREQGSFFGTDYLPGSFRDRLVEAFAGPHDFLNSFMYNSSGNLNSTYAGGIGGLFGEAASWLNVAPASVFVTGSVLQPLIPFAYAIEQR